MFAEKGVDSAAMFAICSCRDLPYFSLKREQMKLNLVAATVGALLLQACAITPSLQDTSKTLAVYPDNRVGYLLTDNERLNHSTHAWTNDKDTILALRFKDRLINARDIDRIDVLETRTRNTPLTVSVTLRGGEFMKMNAVNWGSYALSDGTLEWVACTRERVCEYMSRTQQLAKPLGFTSHPRLFTSVTRTDIDERADRAEKGTAQLNTDGLESFEVDRAMPAFPFRRIMVFRPLDEVKDTDSALKISYNYFKAWNACKREKYAKDAADRQAYIDKALRSNPTKRDLERLELWKMQNKGSNFLTEDTDAAPYCNPRVKVTANAHRARENFSAPAGN